MKAKTHFQFTQLIAKTIDLGVHAKTVVRTALQFVVQPLAIAHETRIFPAALPARAVAQPGIDPRKGNVEPVKFGTKLTVTRFAIVSVTLPALIFVLPIIRLRGSAETGEGE